MARFRKAVSKRLMKIGKTAMSKTATRRQLAHLRFAEKLQILERLRNDLIIGLEKKRTANDAQ